MRSGIYIIEAPTGAMYVGSAINLQGRKREHFSQLRRGVHRNSRLQAAFVKHGDGLEFRVLIVCRPCDLIFFEQRAINILSPGYNIALVAGSCLGIKRGEETRRRLSVAHLGKKDTPETKARKSFALKGHSVSELTRQKLAAQKGWKHSEETKKAMRNRRFSDDHRRALAKAKIGNKNRRGGTLSQEVRERISAKLSGRWGVGLERYWSRVRDIAVGDDIQ